MKMRTLRDLRKDKHGVIGKMVIAIIVVIVVVCLIAVAAFAGLLGDNFNPYQPPDNGHPIIGYVSATIVVHVANSAIFGPPPTYRFNAGSITAELQQQATGASFLTLLDMWSHDVKGTVKFQLTNTALNYNSGRQQGSWAGNVGGGGVLDLTVTWPAGPAIRDHATYQLSCFLYDSAGVLWDTQTANVDL